MNRSDARKQAAALVAQMTPDEKISQLLYTAPAIPRLGIRAYNWWNEALHGVARAGLATVFPQAIGMAAAFSPALVGEAASVIAEEARAKYNMAQKEGDTGIYKGLTFWSPNINIFRDPRWGRGQETYGEDPFLTAEDGMAFVRALQGDGEYMKAAACAKHFAVHSGPEELRHSFDAEVDARDLAETYLPAFEKLVREAHVEAVMGAYNRTNGEPCCGSKTLLADTLRGKWGFSGHVVSDCGAINDFHLHHHVTETAEDAAAMALDAGCDLNCGRMFAYLAAALADGKITEAQLDEAATRLFTTRVLLGEFDENNPYNDIPYERVDCAEYQALNREIARQSLVLLKNDGYLPRDPASVSTVAVIGPNAASVIALEGNYSGTAGEYITPADGIRRALPGARVYVSRGSHLYKNKLEGCSAVPDDRLSEAAAMARRADLVLLCVGLDSTIEGEQGDASNFGAAGDKIDLRLPECQRHLVRTVCEASDNVVVAVLAGSAIDLGEDAAHARAVIHAWYPGARGGEAIADLILGRYSPSGRLPVTFYRAGDTLPDFTDYRMEGRTYRFFEGEPLYPFGYGLSYTTFAYDGFTAEMTPDGHLTGSVRVTNTGAREGDEPVQIYTHLRVPGQRTPRFQLSALEKIRLAPGEAKTVSFDVEPYWISVVTEAGERVPHHGEMDMYAGGHQPDARSEALCGVPCLHLVLNT